jgi:hypothetical protein
LCPRTLSNLVVKSEIKPRYFGVIFLSTTLDSPPPTLTAESVHFKPQRDSSLGWPMIRMNPANVVHVFKLSSRSSGQLDICFVFEWTLFIHSLVDGHLRLFPHFDHYVQVFIWINDSFLLNTCLGVELLHVNFWTIARTCSNVSVPLHPYQQGNTYSYLSFW